MGRRSNVKLWVDGTHIREYIIKRLVNNSYRDLVSEDAFKEKTGIKKLGTLTDWAGKRKFKIKLNEVYDYGISNMMIMPTTTYYEWLEETGRTNMSKDNPEKERKKKRLQKPILLDMCFSIGLEGVTAENTMAEIKELILGFIGEKDFNILYKELEKIHMKEDQ